MHIPPPLLPILAQSANEREEFEDFHEPFHVAVESTRKEENILAYTDWVDEWTSQGTASPDTVIVPANAAIISTPLNSVAWQVMLQDHPNRDLVSFFMLGIMQGFRIGFNRPYHTLRSARKNLGSAIEHPKVVEEYLAAEISQNRVAGPFNRSSIADVHISRFGVIPKGHQSNKWRLIVDLSHPVGHSVNDGISKQLCSLRYITVDTATSHIITFGPGTLLAKIDIKHAFRLLPVHPADRHVLAMHWNNNIYIDTCLPFGLRSAPKLFNILADLLSWIVEEKGVAPILHYLDDFLLLAPPSSDACLSNLNIVKDVCLQLGIPLALEKLEGPSQSLTFLGIILDTQRMEARLPDDKLLRIRTQLAAWLEKKKATKREILSLVGLLQHATKVVKSGRTFLSRMYSRAARLRELHYYTKLTKDFRSDLQWWYVFINSWNGISFLESIHSRTTADYYIATDASGSWGCGGCFKEHWFQYAWPTGWSSVNIMAKELVPIVISCAMWGPLLSKKHTEFHCDNQSLVDAINKGSSKDEMVMHLLRCLWFFTAIFNIRITATHIPGVTNTAADMLSRNQASNFLMANPQASPIPTPLPPPLLLILSPSKLDWTSPCFVKKFKEAICMIQLSAST